MENSIPTSSESTPRGIVGGLLDFVKETKLTHKIYKHFLKPSSGSGIPHSPKGGDKEGNATLNYPFQPISPAVGQVEEGVADLVALDRKISRLEENIKVILTDDAGNGEDVKPKTPNPAVLGITPLDETGQITPSNDMLPMSVYHEIIQILGEQLQTGGCDKCCGPPPPSVQDGDTRGKICSTQNKKRNMRYEVLKWNKD